MQHPNIPPGNNRDQSPRLTIPNLNKTWLKRQDIRITQRKRRRLPFPRNLPIRSRSPPIAIHVKRVVAVVEQELAVETVDCYGLDVFLLHVQVEGGVGRVEEGLRFEGLERDNFEAAGTADAEFGFEEVDGGGFGGDVEFLPSR